MKTNYQLKMEEILKDINLKNPPKLLLHACCAPCSSYVLEILSKYFDITIYYYNPNIYPYEEYEIRLNEIKKFVSDIHLENPIKVISGEYDYNAWNISTEPYKDLKERSIRCYECYKLRMEETIKYAFSNNYDYFTTTLSISPYKNSVWLNEIGEELSKKYNIKYLYADFKKNNGYKKSIELSKKYNLYRQNYCGCIYSKNEYLEHYNIKGD